MTLTSIVYIVLTLLTVGLCNLVLLRKISEIKSIAEHTNNELITRLESVENVIDTLPCSKCSRNDDVQ